jgi:hypothetical protein
MARHHFFYVYFPQIEKEDNLIASSFMPNLFSYMGNLFKGKIFSFTPQFGDRPEGEGMDQEPFYSDQIGIE